MRLFNENILQSFRESWQLFYEFFSNDVNIYGNNALCLDKSCRNFRRKHDSANISCSSHIKNFLIIFSWSSFASFFLSSFLMFYLSCLFRIHFHKFFFLSRFFFLPWSGVFLSCRLCCLFVSLMISHEYQIVRNSTRSLAVILARHFFLFALMAFFDSAMRILLHEMEKWILDLFNI